MHSLKGDGTLPDIVKHNAMADRVLENLDEEIAGSIDRKIFHFSVMGPDPYIYYRFYALPLRHGISRRADIMHGQCTQEFLMELAQRSESQEMFSFLAGFLCHFALDSTTHPFINAQAQDRDDMHAAIERRLDVLELKRQGRQLREIMKLFMPFPDLPEVQEVMKKVYGWDDRYYRISYRHMRWFHFIAKDQHGLLERLLRRMPGKLASVSYRTHMADGLDLAPFDALEEEAVRLGTVLVTEAWKFRAGETDAGSLRERIGTKTYHGRSAT